MAELSGRDALNLSSFYWPGVTQIASGLFSSKRNWAAVEQPPNFLAQPPLTKGVCQKGKLIPVADGIWLVLSKNESQSIQCAVMPFSMLILMKSAL